MAMENSAGESCEPETGRSGFFIVDASSGDIMTLGWEKSAIEI
jgi:hypothetical protein